MTHQNEQAREQLIRVACMSVNRGLNEATTGNLSLRVSTDQMLITPSAIPFGELAPDDLVLMNIGGKASGSGRKPSSEWPFHGAVLKARPDVNAIVHTHSPQATAFSCLRGPLPSFHYMVAALGGKTVPCSDYATPGSERLAELVVATLADLSACLMANHGVIAVGETPEQALDRAQLVETLAKQYLLSLQAGGPVMLTDQQMEEMLEAFKEYGRQPEDD